MEGINYWYLGFYINFCDERCWTVVKAPDYFSYENLILKLDRDSEISKIDELSALNEPENHFSYENIGFDFVQYITNGKTF